MNKVVAIPAESIDAMLKASLALDDKYYILVLIGLASGLRISDILSLRVKDVASSPIRVTEKKTGKEKYIILPVEIQRIIKKYTISNSLGQRDYLIYSKVSAKHKPLSRSQAYNSIKKAAASVGLNGIGCHSLRKTFARHKYKQSGDITSVQNDLNHEYMSTTLLYLIDDFNAIKL